MLQDYIGTLSEQEQCELAIKLIETAMPLWEEYAIKHPLSYVDSATGTSHEVEKDLLAKAILMVEKSKGHPKWQKLIDPNDSILSLRRRFDDPILALQDEDWVLPYPVQRIFYSVFNLLEWSIGDTQGSFGESVIYVAINQALDAIDKSGIATNSELRNIIYG